MKNILLIGAFERDNFGDVLLLNASQPYFEKWEVTFAAPFPGDMTNVFGELVPAYGPLLQSRRFDLVWTVGGGVGTVSMKQAFRMSASGTVQSMYDESPPSERESLLEGICGAPLPESPYMPRLSAFPLNCDTPSVLNSVGVAGVHKQPMPRRAILKQVIAEATNVSVRETQSSRGMSQMGIEHSLVPDIVHALPLHHDIEVAVSDHVLVQASEKYIRECSVEQFAASIAGVEALKCRPIRLFPAGLAPGHDSLEQYERVCSLVREINPTADISIIGDRDPLALAAQIAGAALWIGTSLHGRVVSMAYGTPRISLDTFKLNVYADSWDRYGFSGVTLDKLNEAVGRCLDGIERQELKEFGMYLAWKADQGMKATLAAADATTRQSVIARRIRASEDLRTTILGSVERTRLR